MINDFASFNKTHACVQKTEYKQMNFYTSTKMCAPHL